MQPALAPGGDAVLLNSGGRARLRYTGLRAWDAAGRELEARLEVRGQEVRLAIADAGAAYPLTVDPVLQAELLASDGAANDHFGYSVAVSGDTAVIGAPYRASDQGAAYVFTRSGGVWTQQSKLTASDGVADDCFGYSVAVSGDTAVIGAPNKASYQGAAYVFTRSGGVWTEHEQAKLTASDSEAGDRFGVSVAVSGETAVIGAVGKASAQGAAYVFTRSTGGWTEEPKLTASDGAARDWFGFSVAVSGDTAVIGAPYKASHQGAAYVFTRSSGVWSQQARLTVSDGAAYDSFGHSVAVSGDTVVIGADGKADKGAAYVFRSATLTVVSIPPGRPFTAVGTGCPSGRLTTPYELTPEIGCAISFPSPALNSAGNARYTFQQWFDGDTSNPRWLLSPLQGSTFVAQFSTEYQLTAAASPASGGQVTGSG